VTEDGVAGDQRRGDQRRRHRVGGAAVDLLIDRDAGGRCRRPRRADRDGKQLIVRGALLGIVEDTVRANQLPETHRCVRIVGIGVGMSRFRGLPKSDPQSLRIIVRKGLRGDRRASPWWYS
jgi:hypothetical protein